MSGVITGLTKVFMPVVSGLKTAIGKGISAIGAATATAGAASGGGIITGAAQQAAQPLFSGGGILSRLFGGAQKVSSGLGSSAISATGGGLVRGKFLQRAGDFLKTEGGAGLVAGIGGGLMKAAEMRQQAREAQLDREALAAENEKDRQAKVAEQTRITNSYEVDPSALPGGASVVPEVKNAVTGPPPAQRYDRGFTWVYDANLGRTVKVFN